MGPRTQRTMVVTLIGTGRLGTNLHHALTEAGHEVVWLHGRDFAAEDVRGEVVVICVKDDAIMSVAERLGNTRALVVHTSGSTDIGALPQPRRGVFYPMQTFSRERLVDFAEIPVFLEADDAEDMKLLVQLASSFSRNVRQLDSQRRRYLHLAAVFACNFTNHCYDLAAQVLSKVDLPFEVMLSLIDETARKVHTMTPQEAQTGPAIRYDEQVIRRHEGMLEGNAKEIYHLMSKSIHDKLRTD